MCQGGGDKDADYWAWRKGGSDSSSEEDEFMKWINNKRNSKQDDSRRDRNRKQEGNRKQNGSEGR